MYDSACFAFFSKKDLNIFKNNKIILQGLCNQYYGLWDVPILQDQALLKSVSSNNQQINVITHKNQLQYNLVIFIMELYVAQQ